MQALVANAKEEYSNKECQIWQVAIPRIEEALGITIQECLNTVQGCHDKTQDIPRRLLIKYGGQIHIDGAMCWMTDIEFKSLWAKGTPDH